ncbi:MAG: hypothetical protein NUV35_01715, partial [Syntrophomonadaceae bacterium]|nr:hypothetical protein [Syntrophomonadaceae bacterium]
MYTRRMRKLSSVALAMVFVFVFMVGAAWGVGSPEQCPAVGAADAAYDGAASADSGMGVMTAANSGNEHGVTPLTGAIWTTDADCNEVNENVHYATKQDVYLNGGPNNEHGGQALPDGWYWVKVTDPSGHTLLGISEGPVVEVRDGRFVSCVQLWSILVKGSDGSQGYDSSPNNGDEYKVWISPTEDFDQHKTDNFKVRQEEKPPCGEVTATKTACGIWYRGIDYDWTVDKVVEPTAVTVKKGQKATVTYTITATRGEPQQEDEAWVTGQVCVNNGLGVAITVVQVHDWVEFYKEGAWHPIEGASATWEVNKEVGAKTSETVIDEYQIPFAPQDGAEKYRNLAEVTCEVIDDGDGNDGCPCCDGCECRVNVSCACCEPEPGCPAEGGVIRVEPVEFELDIDTDTTDATATLTDAIHAPAGFSYTVIDTGDGTGPWFFEGSGSISFDLEITNDNVGCGQHLDLDNLATLTEDDSRTERTDPAQVHIYTGTCEGGNGGDGGNGGGGNGGEPGGGGGGEPPTVETVTPAPEPGPGLPPLAELIPAPVEVPAAPAPALPFTGGDPALWLAAGLLVLGLGATMRR